MYRIYFYRFDESARILGPAGPNPQYRLISAQLRTGEKIIINKNVYFEDGKPMKNR
jgi:hypothetical protein